MKIILVFLILFSIKVFSQERIDERLPKLYSPNASITAMKGWTKTSIGKWVGLPNGIPQFEDYVSKVMPYCEQVLKIEVGKVNIADKDYTIVTKFLKHIYGNRMEKLEYGAEYWVFEMPGFIDTLSDMNVKTQSYKTLVCNRMFGFYKPVTQTDISKNIKLELSKQIEDGKENEDRFFIQSRIDKKNKMVQFMLGTHTKEYDKYDYHLLCSGDENNIELSIMYYEISEVSFKNAFHRIIY